ncbi:MAG: hypothetical protein KDE01_33835, partial [Caldilineaceae bacterium]|nr:hypothetical protein [Caldilineaceae bacterium]
DRQCRVPPGQHLCRAQRPILLQHADAQRIPLPPYPPPTPLVTTTTHAVDKVQQDGKKQVVEITHHYRHAEHYDN